VCKLAKNALDLLEGHYPNVHNVFYHKEVALAQPNTVTW
jgi:hypothetical protein